MDAAARRQRTAIRARLHHAARAMPGEGPGEPGIELVLDLGLRRGSARRQRAGEHAEARPRFRKSRPAGERDFGRQFASISSAITLIKSSRLRALGVTGLKRSASLPDIMTISEAALPGYDAVAWYGLIAPANLPATILNTTHKAAVESLAQTEVKNRLAAAGVDLRILGPVEFAAYSNAEIQKWAKIIKVSGAKAE